MLLGPVESGDPDDWRTMVDVNLLGLLYCTRDVLQAEEIAGAILYPVSRAPHVSSNEILIRPTGPTR